MMAAMLVALAAPALANHDNDFLDDNCFFFDGVLFCDDDDDDGVFFDRDFDFEDGISQETEQEAESGDIDQDFDVSGSGDNSNQTAGTQGVANTGNAQNSIGVIDAGD